MNPDVKNSANIPNVEMLQVQYDAKLKQYNQAIEDLNAMRRYLGLTLPSVDQINEFTKTNPVQDKDLLRAQQEIVTSDNLNAYANSAKTKKGVLRKYENKSFWGQRGFKSVRKRNSSSCLRVCKRKNLCSGATFSPDTKMCYLRTGPGKLQSSFGKVAIVNDVMVKLNELKEYNSQLLEINSKIIDLILGGGQTTSLDRYIQDNNRQNTAVIKDHNRLVEQRNMIDDMITEYDSSNIKSSDTGLVTASKLLSMRGYILLLIALIAVPVVHVYGLPNNYVSAIIASLLFWYLNMRHIAIVIAFLAVLVFAYNVPLEKL